MDYGWMLVRMVLVLAAVCALAYGLLRWGLRRLAPMQNAESANLEVVEQLGVGPKRSIMVVRAGDDYLLVGCSEAGFEALGRLDPEGFDDLIAATASTGAGEPDGTPDNESQ